MRDTTTATATVTLALSTGTSTRVIYIVRVNGADKEFSIAEFAFMYAEIVALIPDTHICVFKRTTITEILF